PELRRRLGARWNSDRGRDRGYPTPYAHDAAPLVIEPERQTNRPRADDSSSDLTIWEDRGHGSRDRRDPVAVPDALDIRLEIEPAKVRAGVQVDDAVSRDVALMAVNRRECEIERAGLARQAPDRCADVGPDPGAHP